MNPTDVLKIVDKDAVTAAATAQPEMWIMAGTLILVVVIMMSALLYFGKQTIQYMTSRDKEHRDEVEALVKALNKNSEVGESVFRMTERICDHLKRGN